MGFGVCSGWEVFDESDCFLLDADEWLNVGFAGVCCAPYGDVADEVGVCMGEVEGSECVCWEELFCVFEAADERSEFLDDVDDCLVVFEVVLHGDSSYREGGLK